MRICETERGLIVDEFAGGGGASQGIGEALGREVDIAVNHDAAAIAMHAVNHPMTRHYRSDVFKLDPRKVCRGRSVYLAWFSPDCRHFSRAKGGKPVSRRVRGLARIAVIWAQMKQPSIIIIENVREFQDWGPLIAKLDAAGRAVLDVHGNPVLIPDPTRKGQSFRRFVARFRTLGYAVEWRDLDAADYGAPTHRRRLFLIARRDGAAIAWPAVTHAPAEKAAALGLLPYRSAAECIDWSIPCPSIFERKRQLVANTMRRIAHGFMRYVKNSAKPFIVRYNTEKGAGAKNVHGVDVPMPTVVSENRFGVVVPYIVQSAHGGHNYRAQDIRNPLHSVLGTNAHAVVAPHAVLIAPWIAKHFGGAVGADARRPLPTTTRRGTQNQAAAAYLVHLNHGEKQWSAADEPMRTVTTGKHAAEVRAFLVKYYGAEKDGQALDVPLGTVVSKDRFGLVTVTIDGELYVVVDIGMRMLTPRELARAQGFPDSYVLTGSIENQVARIGNSVCPAVARAVVAANCAEYARQWGGAARVAA